jgi:hypothetical protein
MVAGVTFTELTFASAHEALLVAAYPRFRAPQPIMAPAAADRAVTMLGARARMNRVSRSIAAKLADSD